MGDYMRKIRDVALDLGVRDIDIYGDYKAKINDFPLKKRGKLILVTATSPTPYGEGKTTLSIGLNDALFQVMRLIYILQEIFMRLLQLTIYFVRQLIIIFFKVMNLELIRRQFVLEDASI